MSPPSIVFHNDFHSDFQDGNFYTDVSEPGDTINFCDDEPLDNLFTDFDFAFISVPEYDIFYSVAHFQLFRLSQYYRSSLSWNHGITRSDNPNVCPNVSVVTLPPILSRTAIFCFIDLFNGIHFNYLFLRHYVDIILISNYLAIDDSCLKPTCLILTHFRTDMTIYVMFLFIFFMIMDIQPWQKNIVSVRSNVSFSIPDGI